MEDDFDFLDQSEYSIVFNANQKVYQIYCKGRLTTDQIFDTLEAAEARVRQLQAGTTFADFVRAGVGS